MTKRFPNFIVQKGIRHVRYLIGPHINDNLSIKCNAFNIIILYNGQFFQPFNSSNGIDR